MSASPGLRDAQGGGKTFFPGVSERVFQEEISIRISRLREEDPRHQHPSMNWTVGIIQFIEGLKRRTRQRKDTFALVAWTGASIFFRPSDSGTPHSWTFRFGLGLILPALLVSGLWTWIELYYCFFLVLQFTRDRLWDFLASIIK